MTGVVDMKCATVAFTLIGAFWFLSCSAALEGTGAPVNPTSLPNGWRLPLASELATEKCGMRPPTPLDVSVDLDGDGISDKVVVAVNVEQELEGLLVHLSGQSDKLWQVVEVRAGVCATYGLDIVSPGTYSGFYCSAVAEDCDPQQKQQVRFSLPGIVFYELGRTGVTLFWNNYADGFDRVWEGD